MIERSSSHVLCFVHLVLSILIRVWSSTSAILAKRLCVILTYFQNQKYGKRASAHLVFQLARLLLYLCLGNTRLHRLSFKWRYRFLFPQLLHLATLEVSGSTVHGLPLGQSLKTLLSLACSFWFDG